MENNKVRIIVDEGIDITFHFSDIVALKYGKTGFHAIVLLDNQKVKIPVTYKSFSDAAKYIGENIKHCNVCAHRLTKVDVKWGERIEGSYWECPKCSKTEPDGN